jgi:hypothetical protein
MQQAISPKWIRIKRVQGITAWLSLLSAIILFVADSTVKKYPGAVGYQGAPMPPSWMFEWRYTSLILTSLLSLISIPRWQAWVCIVAVFGFLYLQSLI